MLVTAINPTSLGEGKTTTAIGLADGMAKIGKKVCLALREPSLGPVFGIKGGATGGGRAQVTRRVPRTMFTPRPNVDSAVVRIDFELGRLVVQS